MSAAARPLFPVADYALPEGTRTIGVAMRCGCSPHPRVRNLHVTEAAVVLMRQFPIPRDFVMESFRCQGCKTALKVTAEMLYFAA